MKTLHEGAKRWIQTGVIRPEVRGVGRRFLLSESNIVELQNLARLRRSGVSLQAARKLMADLRGQSFNPLSKGTFVAIVNKSGTRRHPAIVIRFSEDRAHARVVAGPGKGQYEFVELLPMTPRRPPKQRFPVW